MAARALLAAALLALCAATTGLAPAQEMRFFRIGTGGVAGTYYPIGGLIADIISNPPGARPCDKGGSCGVPGLVAIAQSSNGAVANVDAIASGNLESRPRPAFADAVAVTVVLASEGYPQSPVTGRRLSGLDAAAAVEGVHLAHAATAETEGGLVATGGRVLNVVGLGTTFAEARDRVYRSIAEIGLEGGQHRTDIAARVVEH